MDDEIENPVREHREGNKKRHGLRGARHHDSIESKGANRPKDRPDETVCVRHVIEVERIGCVEELNRDEEDPQGDGWAPCFMAKLTP